MTDQTATERLRQLLDERGVEWDATTGALGTVWTHWDAFNGHRVHAMDNGDGTVEIFGEWDVTPEQAVAATLDSCSCSNSERTSANDATRERQGVGTCHNTWDVELTGRLRFQCSECGAVSLEITPRFCPNCGRKVVGPTTNDVGGEVDE